MPKPRISRERLTLFPNMLRTCAACKRDKPRTEYYTSNHVKDGLESHCKQCTSEKVSSINRQKTFGIDKATFTTMTESQNGKCAICKKPPSRRFLSVDHCHTTGTVRALLCNNCNTAIGFAYDDPTLLRAMADYIEHHTAKKVAHEDGARSATANAGKVPIGAFAPTLTRGR